jgi:hypothetical protein
MNNYKCSVFTLIIFTMIGSACSSHPPTKIPYEPYTKADIDAKMTCAVAVAKGEFYAGKIGLLGSPRVCQGVKASENSYWECISNTLDKTHSFLTSADKCQSFLSKP